jgi:hypothetical protein
MLGTKLDWLCNAIVPLVIVLALGLVWTKPQYKAPDRLTVAEWTEREIVPLDVEIGEAALLALSR